MGTLLLKLSFRMRVHMRQYSRPMGMNLDAGAHPGPMGALKSPLPHLPHTMMVCGRCGARWLVVASYLLAFGHSVLGASQPLWHVAWSLVTALLLLTSGHSGLGVSRLPCGLAVGHCLVPCDPVSDTGESPGQGSLQLPCSPKLKTASFSRHAAL